MKKTLIALLCLFILFAGGFVWLLGQASSDNAPQAVQTIDLPDTYEK